MIGSENLLEKNTLETVPDVTNDDKFKIDNDDLVVTMKEKAHNSTAINSPNASLSSIGNSK